MKRVFIIHGWEGSPDEPMHVWLASELRKEGYEVTVPVMPGAYEPRIETWVPYLSEIVGTPDSNTFFIGHSIGCQAVLRYLETLPEETKIGGAVFIAGWYNLRNLETEEEKEIVGPWVNLPRKDEKVKKIINKATVIISDNDPWIDLDNQIAWKERLGAEVIIENNKGHFTESDNVTELPSAIRALRSFN